MTVDLLLQRPCAEVISEQLRSNARKALRVINRFPVCQLEDLLPKGQNGNGGAPEPGPEATARPGPQGAPAASPEGSRWNWRLLRQCCGIGLPATDSGFGAVVWTEG